MAIVGPSLAGMLEGGIGVPGAGGGLSGPAVSIEKVTVSFGASDNLKQVNLTKGQDESQCVPFASGRWTDVPSDDSGNNTTFSVKVYDNAGTAALEIERGAGVNAHEFTIYVVEFISDIRVTRVDWSQPSGIADTVFSLPITVGAYGDAFIINWSRLENVSDNVDDMALACWVNDLDTVKIDRVGGGTASGLYGTVYVVEDTTDGNEWFTVQRLFNGPWTGDQNVTISAVDLEKTWEIAGSITNQSSSWRAYDGLQCNLTSTTNVLFEIDIGGTTKYPMTHIVKWNKGITVQRVRFSELSTTDGDRTLTAAISEVDLDKSIIVASRQQQLLNGSQASTSGANNLPQAHWELDLQDSTTARGRYRNTTQSNTCFIEAKVISFD